MAKACNPSVRWLADVEGGVRSNFKASLIARLEEGLRWPAGTIDQIVSEPDLTSPAPTAESGFLFRPPEFDRQPVAVEVPAVERALTALANLSRDTATGAAVSPAAISDATVALCWPYVLRPVEHNCQPGHQLHPAVRPLYDVFKNLAREFAAVDPTRRYAQWLVGDGGELDEADRRRYSNRWHESQLSRSKHP